MPEGKSIGDDVTGGALGRLDRLISRGLHLASFLVLPLAVLLFLQWPLREVVQAYAREANDLAQILFAVYISLAITAATRQSGHLAADAYARRFTRSTRRRIERVATVLVLMPWAAFLTWAAWPGIVQAVRAYELFPETYNQGYFVVKAAVALLALGVLLQAIVDVLRRLKGGEG